MSFPEAIAMQPPFALMTPEERQVLWDAGEVQEHEANNDASEALDTHGLHLMLSGKALYGPANERIERPSFLPESGCVLLPFDCHASFQALEPTRTYSLSKAAFDDLLDRGEGAAFVLLDFLIHKTSRELRELNAAVQQVLRDVPSV